VAVRDHLIKIKRAHDGSRSVIRSELSGQARFRDLPRNCLTIRDCWDSPGNSGQDVGDAYGFRCESSFAINRPLGIAGFQPPHCGPTAAPLKIRFVNGGSGLA